MKYALIVAAVVSCASGQQAGNANAHYSTEAERANIAARMLAPGRDAEQKPAALVASLPIKPGMTVADIGTGPGYMLPYLSRGVGPEGRVLAEDVFPDMLEQARRRIEAEKLSNVTSILGTAEDPKLPAAAVDVAFLLDVYHHFDSPGRMLAQIRAALKEDGTLVLVDYYKRPGAMSGGNAVEHIRADQPDVIKEVESNGFKLASKRDHVPNSQYVLLFRKSKPN
jgi:ubiquinone/menaquinone biosynthesis C-methylase UbiE